ncbi:flagella biosynthesis regulatory protein FliZ [Atlantibacter hermannii]|uniref:flagella biosynthesis regulatory protein FliZ n=1 Tax=Atlantibacter hermannii TaxID=565 RepID=UPI0022B7A261|nr:flagella biosynthesis regulatory protein FliZ [Atlantibacter hermannii]MCZ7834992.1 flagella biosynthesis regulatory protein FliZ [Atlantibacter hermannii]
MTEPQQKKRPISRYLKDFKHAETHCAQCGKLLDRITLVHRGTIVNKTAIAQLDTLIDEATWASQRHEWSALCRFCGDLHCKVQSEHFDIIGFKQYLFERTDMSPGTIREYVVRLRRLGEHLEAQQIPADQAQQGEIEDQLERWLPPTSTNNYRIALRKYSRYLHHSHQNEPAKALYETTSAIY